MLPVAGCGTLINIARNVVVAVQAAFFRNTFKEAPVFFMVSRTRPIFLDDVMSKGILNNVSGNKVLEVSFEFPSCLRQNLGPHSVL